MIRVFGDSEELSRAAAQEVAEIGRRCVAERGRFDLVLSGGGTPIRTYEFLAETTPDDRRLWDNTHFFWGDERCVAPDDSRSNHRMARLMLLDPLRIAPAQIWRIEGEDANPREAAARYETVFPPRPDLILLGMGEEGHTASLFPGSPALDEKARRFLAVEVPAQPPRRITMTPPVMAAARSVFMLVSGSNKVPAFHRAFSPDGDFHELPARLVREAMWFVDKAAAGHMSL